MKTMKRKIATLLVGTMLATQPASLPVWGAAVTQPGAPTGSNFQFNFTDLNPSLKNIIQNINITGGTANTLIDTGSGDFHGMEVNHTNHYVYLPFVSPDTGNPDNGTFDNTKTLDGKSWDNIGLEGYAIEHWMSDKENGFGLWRMDGLNYPSNGKTYYAKLKADPSKNYNLRVKYTADTGVYVPGLPANLDTTKNVLDAIPQSPIVPNGFKITNTGADDTVKFFKPNTSPLFTTPFTGFNATDSGFTMDNNKNLSGTMVNKDTEITFNYAVDTGVKKSLQVVDEIYQDAALTVLSGRKGRVGGLYYESALENIGTKNIGPNTNISTKDVTRAASSDRYILKEVNISYIDSDRNIAISNPTANATLLTNDAVSATGNYTRLTANSVSAATGAGEISGQMPNQDVKITYKYYINPSFETTLSVKYMDDRGNDITSLILSEYERANGALPTTTGASNGSKYKEVDGSGNATFLKFKTGYSSTGSYNINIPVPKVANYKYGTDHPKAQLNGGTATWGSSYQTAIANIDSSWSDTNQYFDLTTVATGPIENKEIIVTYAVDPTAIVQLIPINGAGGSIKVANSPTAAEYNVNTDAAINLSRLNQTSTSTTYDVDIKPSDMIYYPVPNAGYRFDHWETSSELGSQLVNLNLGTPQTVTGIPKSKNTITLTAKF
ncbi:MAG: hypothetical protein D8H95_42450, partial [Lachnospiraceae bacterium]